MKILVVNAGSSSLKFQLFDMKDESVLAKGNCEKIGLDDSFISYKKEGVNEKLPFAMPNHTEAIKRVLSLLTDKKYGVISTLSEISAVGHRAVHGGWIFDKSVLLTDKVLADFASLTDLSPLHQMANIAGIKACREVLPNVPQVLVFDTAFHQTMPPKAYNYAIKYEDAEKYHIRKYGFHGTSHRFIMSQAAKVMGKKPEDLKIISVHLGNGSSITAIDHGKSVDTTMGLTPLEGLMMGTRSGDIDPSVISFLCEKKGMSASECVNYLNKQCGVQGVSGVSSDMREINDAISKGNERARLALDMLIYRVKKYIGAYMAVLGGADIIVFTGGIGENQDDLREEALKGLECFGIEIDAKKNSTLPRGEISEISTPKSKVKVYRIPTDEELLIARDTMALASKR